MRFAIDRKIRLGYISAFIILIISYVLLFTTTEKVLKYTKRSNTLKDNILHLELLNSSIINYKLNLYNYLSSDSTQFLHMYNDENAKIDSSLKLIYNVVNDSLQLAENLRLKELVNRLKITYMPVLVELSSSKEKSHDIKNSISDKVLLLLDTTLHQIKIMQSRQLSILNMAGPSSNGYFRALKVINLTSLIIAILIAVYSLLTYSKENYARRESDGQATVYRTQLEQQIEQLNTSNKELNDLKSMEKFAATGRMARMIAHEVRNPLTNIGLANDQLKDAVEGNEENVMLMNMIKRNGERINQLVGDLLNATKFVELNKSNYNINDLLDDVIIMAKDRIDLNKIQIIKNYSDKICTVSVDADKIKIAFLNVLINSIEAVKPENGKIEIITMDVDNMCVVIIKDNGSGMSTEVQLKLFEPFFTSKDKGNGLGLTNTQNIILNHKGNITVDSQVGKGTDFIIKLNFA